MVGIKEDKATFNLPTNLLLGSSPFFKAALGGKFKEAETSVLNMPEEIVEVIHRFRLWLYTSSPLSMDESVKDADWLLFIRLYIFADKYRISDLQNMVIDILVAKLRATGEWAHVWTRFVYEYTVDSSHLRRLFVDVMAQLGHLEDIFKKPENVAKYPDDFIADVIKALSVSATALCAS